MCGIAAAYPVDSRGVVESLASILLELQHRGQEAAGIAVVTRDGRLKLLRGPGTIFEAMPIERLRELASEEPVCGIGHVRYSTSGGYMEYGAQPIVAGKRPRIALAFNGNIVNYAEIARIAGLTHVPSDAYALAGLVSYLATEHGGDVIEALRELPSYVVGSYSLAILTDEPRIVVARDPIGFRPLSISLGPGLYAASENPALEAIGLERWREVEPGEIVSFDGSSLEVTRARGGSGRVAPCIFEYVYFSRPDSVFNGVEVYSARLRMGMELGRNAPAEADIVIPVPDSGRPAAIGFSRVTGIPIGEGFAINKYLGRGFISPPSIRGAVTRLKYGVIRSEVRGRRVVLVDDSIVRGTTIRALASRIYRAGAREVHVRVASPPFRYPCFMGIDVPVRRELAAWRKSLGELAKDLGVDSVAYNTLESVVKAVGLPSVCHACFSGLYPLPGIDLEEVERVLGVRR